MAVPILSSNDLAASESFYARLGYEAAGRHDEYLVLHDEPVEVHLSQQAGQTDHPGTRFVRVADATAYWEQLKERGVPNLSGPVAQDHGLTEFTILGPDLNLIRFGSPTA